MSKSLNNIFYKEEKLYNKILLLSRNKIIYTDLTVKDTFQNRINLIFLHFSFIIVEFKSNNNDNFYKAFHQKLFDFIFKNIEINMREIGYGDVSVNKNMKFLVKVFYNILKNCEKYANGTDKYKFEFLSNHLDLNVSKLSKNNDSIVKYFDKFHAFCLDLTPDSVLKGNLNFTYK